MTFRFLDLTFEHNQHWTGHNWSNLHFCSTNDSLKHISWNTYDSNLHEKQCCSVNRNWHQLFTRCLSGSSYRADRYSYKITYVRQSYVILEFSLIPFCSCGWGGQSIVLRVYGMSFRVLLAGTHCPIICLLMVYHTWSVWQWLNTPFQPRFKLNLVDKLTDVFVSLRRNSTGMYCSGIVVMNSSRHRDDDVSMPKSYVAP
jgi:hypothetical protein